MDYKSRQWLFAAAYSQALKPRPKRPAEHNPAIDAGNMSIQAIAGSADKIAKTSRKAG